MKECPFCGGNAIDMTCSGDRFQKFACPSNHRWELRPVESADTPEQTPSLFKRFLQRIFG